MNAKRNSRKLRSALGFALLALVALAASAAPAAAQGVSFVEPLRTTLTFPNGGGSIGVAQGDFNNDLVVDLAVTRFINVPGVGNRGFLSIMLGNGDGTFQPPLDIAFPTSPAVAFGYGIIARDFNGDGNLDLAVASYELRQVLYFQGNGNGAFAAPIATTLTYRPLGLQVADLNGDSKLDLVTLNSSDNSVSVLLGNGDGTFQSPVNYAVAANPQDLAVADVDGVNGPDIVVGAYDAQAINVLLNDGTGHFPVTPLTSNPRGQVTGVYVADFDGDGKPDLVASIVAGPVFMSLVFMKGNGNGTFTAPPDSAFIPLGGAFPRRGTYSENVTVDVNGDGKPDVIFGYGTSSTNYVTVGFGDGLGGFPAISNWVASPGSSRSEDTAKDYDAINSLLVGDFNGDGALDIATATFNTSSDVRSSAGLSILLAMPDASGAPTGNFFAPRSYQTAHRAAGGCADCVANRGAVLGNFRHTGNLDLAVLTADSLARVDLLPGNGDGTFGSAFGAMGGVGGEGFVTTLRTADFKGDGNLGLIWQDLGGVQGSDNPRTLIAFGAGDGTFTLGAVLTPAMPGWRGANYALGDFNNDGLPDVAVWTNRGCLPGTCFPHIEVFLNNGGGTFTRTAGSPQMDIGQIPDGGNVPGTEIAIGDFDGDGKQDIVVHGSSSGQLTLLFFKGNGDGTFQPPTVVVSDLPTPHDIAVADVNGDSRLDLIQAAGNGVFIQLGNGDGTFQPPVSYDSGGGGTNSAAQSVAVADFNGDGFVDLAVGNGNSAFAVLLGNGDGTFQAPALFATGSNGQFVSVGDLNGDQQPDLVLLHPGTAFNYATALINNSVAPTPQRTAGKRSR